MAAGRRRKPTRPDGRQFVGVLVPVDALDRVDAIAVARDVSRSDVIREAIARLLDEGPEPEEVAA